MTENYYYYFIHIVSIIIIFLKIIFHLNTLSVEKPKFDATLGPYDEKSIDVNINEKKLFDVENFTYILNSEVCDNAVPLLIVIVSSSPEHEDYRSAIRESWGKVDDTLKLVFLIGLSTDDAVPIMKEHRRFGDIVQGSFVDSYRNLSYKHVMGLKWVTKYCSQARYVMKTDDDVMFNIAGLKYYLVRKISPWGTRNFVACEPHYTLWVPTVSIAGRREDYYPADNYLNFCLGWVIIYSRDIIKRLLEEVPNTSYFWKDDFYITGMVAKKLNILQTSWKDYIYPGEVRNLSEKITVNSPPFLIGPMELFVHQIPIIWKAMPDHWIWNPDAI